MSETAPVLSVVIPTYNAAPWIVETLRRIPEAAAETSWETVIADNGSGDGTPRLCEGAHVLESQLNRGFSAAVNSAVRASRGRIVVVANQDLFLAPASLDAIAKRLTSETAVLGGRLLSVDGRWQPSCGPFPGLASTLARLALPRQWRKYHLCHQFGTDPATVDWVTGAYMAFPRDLFDDVGGFDEGFFMYYEDVDFCLRARQKGYPVYFVPDAQAVHSSPYSERKDVPEWLQREVRLSQMRYFYKHRPLWEAKTIRALNRVYFAAHGWAWPPVGKAGSK